MTRSTILAPLTLPRAGKHKILRPAKYAHHRSKSDEGGDD